MTQSIYDPTRPFVTPRCGKVEFDIGQFNKRSLIESMGMDI